jgi:GNAT superfamily N-acetyltransferase
MINIYHAEETDSHLILDFIREFAAHIGSSDQVVATEGSLSQTLFGNTRYAEVLLANFDDQPAGFALFFHTYSTFLGKPGIYLEDLFVRPAFRNQGIGAALMHHLADLAVERGCGRFEWNVLTWNEDAMRFYTRLGAEPLDHLRGLRLSGEALKKLARTI